MRGGQVVAGFILTMAACSSRADTQTVTVGPEREDCYGPFLMKCLVVDGGLFYSEIDVRQSHHPRGRLILRQGGIRRSK